MSRDTDRILKHYGAAVDELKNIDFQLEAFEALSQASVDALRMRKVTLEAALKQMRDEMGASTAKTISRTKANDLHTFKNDPHAAER